MGWTRGTGGGKEEGTIEEGGGRVEEDGGEGGTGGGVRLCVCVCGGGLYAEVGFPNIVRVKPNIVRVPQRKRRVWGGVGWGKR